MLKVAAVHWPVFLRGRERIRHKHTDSDAYNRGDVAHIILPRSSSFGMVLIPSVFLCQTGWLCSLQSKRVDLRCEASSSTYRSILPWCDDCKPSATPTAGPSQTPVDA